MIKSFAFFLALSAASFAADILPGSGWGGVATPQPADQGSSGAFGYAYRAIARWDVVPFRTHTSAIKVGVVAFHTEGINRVEFSVENGTWVAVTTPTLNSDTGVVEYWVTVTPSNFTDGLKEIRAVVYPNVGKCRVLGGSINTFTGNHSTWLHTNANGTYPAQQIRYVSNSGLSGNTGLTAASPKATIYQAMETLTADSGVGVIKLAAGSYQYGPDGGVAFDNIVTKGWLTIQPQDGVARADCKITSVGSGGDGLKTTHVRFYNMTLNQGPVTTDGLVDYLWYDNCYLTSDEPVGASPDPGLYDDSTTFGGQWTGFFVTDVTVYRVKRGISNATLLRGCTQSYIGEGFHANCGMIINSTDSDAARPNQDPVLHPDVYQTTQSMGNVIWYNCTATTEIDDTFGIRIQESGTDYAMVNVNITMGSMVTYLWQLERPYTNFFVKSCTWGGASISNEPASGFVATHMVFEDCTFNSPTFAPSGTGITVRTSSSNPVFSLQPESIALRSSGVNHTFNATASGSPTYQWRKDSVNLSGKTDTSLVLVNVQVADSGVFDVVATNGSGSTTSTPATLIISTVSRQKVNSRPRR